MFTAGTCECGCGEPTKWDKENKRPCRFVQYHHLRTPEMRKLTSENAKTYVGRRNPNWRGGRTEGNGYTLLYVAPGEGSRHTKYRLEGRIAMERILGRALTNNEIVWHIDQDPKNVAPENLEVVSHDEAMRRTRSFSPLQ